MTAPDGHVAIVGAGSWGTALALVAGRNGRPVSLWTRDSAIANGIQTTGYNPRYLTDVALPRSVKPTTSMKEAIVGAKFAFLVVPSHVMRDTVGMMREHIGADTILITAAKGIENITLMRMSQVIEETVSPRTSPQIVVLSGPSFSREVAQGDPTAIVAASREPGWSQAVQQQFSYGAFRIYTNDDVVGVELGGAIKNVIAIAAGVVRGLGFGSNSAAAIITRGLAEMTRLALACGARVETMAGLAGLGDLVLTCTGELSRNRQVGIELGRGRELSEIVATMNEVAEGVNTTRAIRELGIRLNISLPITQSVYTLLYEGQSPVEAANNLMDRPLKRE